MVFEREAPIAPETACPSGGSSGCDIACVGMGDVKGRMIERLGVKESAGKQDDGQRHSCVLQCSATEYSMCAEKGIR
jgi:hypothetical protein